MKASPAVFLILSFIAGFADTATFIHLSGLFSSHVTGNFVMLAAAWKSGAPGGDVLKIVAVPVFVVAVFLATAVHDQLQREKPESRLDRRLVPFAGALLLGAAALAYFYGSPGASGEYSSADAIAGLIAVVAMGTQNAIHRFASALGPTTTVMTSNVTQLTVLASRRLLKGPPPAEKAPALPFSLRGIAGLVLFFALGCALSAVATLAAGLVSLAVPG